MVRRKFWESSTLNWRLLEEALRKTEKQRLESDEEKQKSKNLKQDKGGMP